MLSNRERSELLHKWSFLNQEKNDFLDFEDFLEFAEESGFQIGFKLTRIRPKEPHSRENTRFMTSGQIREMRIQQRQEKRRSEAAESVARWNRCVHEPFRHIVQAYLGVKPKREVFRYEHPDRVREAREMGGDSAPSRERSYL